ncbi:Acidic endochitinase WIN6 [Bienertia sinuspersici]
MRFLFECFTVPSNSSSSSSTCTSEEPTTTTEESQSLVVRRRRKRTSTKGSSAEWKPSLHVISEDNSVSTTVKKVVDRKPGSSVVSSRNVKRCGPSSAQVNARSQSHEFRYEFYKSFCFSF